MTADRTWLIKVFREAEAVFDADPWQGRPILIQAATDLVLAGIATPAVVALAGDDKADDREITRDLRQAREQLHLDTMTTQEAGTAQCRWAARAYLAGSITSRAAASVIAGADAESGYSIDVGLISQIADALFDDPPGADEEEFRRAALDVLSREGG